MLKAKKGRLLISEPSLTDKIFFKSVILLTHHNKVESIGLILNHATSINLNEILTKIPVKDLPVYIGGPVGKNSLQFIHTLGKKIPNAIKIFNGLYWGGDFEEVIKLMNNQKISKNDIRFFAGYSGWEEQQLENEINNGGWIIKDATKEECMSYSKDDLWSNIMKTQSQEYAIWANLPKNPNLN